MRMTVTRLGGRAGGGASVAKRIVDYLEKDEGLERKLLEQAKERDQAQAHEDAIGRYFIGSVDGPGVWLGRGAEELGLRGQVERREFEMVLQGRHPVTGQRLVGASGSSGRRHLVSGTASRFSDTGEALYSVADVAALFGLSSAVVTDMIDVGEQLDPEGSPAVASWLRSVELDGVRYVPASEVQRWLDLTQAGVSSDAVARTGPADETLTVAEAAQLMGVSRQYIRRLCLAYSKDPVAFDAGEGTGEWIRSTLVSDGDRPHYEIRRGDLGEFAARRKVPAVRCGFDLTLTTEKSFGILMLLGGPEVSQACEDALDAGNVDAIAFMEDNATFTRSKGERVWTTGLTVASYLHGTSRALDPFPHRHNIVANTALDANGDRKTLDARAFYDHAPTAAALATARMRYELTTRLGVSWRLAPTGVWEIDGISDEVIAEFSQRRNEINNVVGEMERILGKTLTKDEVQQIVLETRDRKTPTTIAELLASWQERAASHGLDLDALARCTPGRGAGRVTLWTDEVQAQVFARLAGPDGLTRNVNTFTRGDVVRAIVDFNVGTPDRPELLVVSPDEIEPAADSFLASHQVAEIEIGRTATSLLASPPVVEPRFSTMDLLETQERIHLRYAAGHTRASAWLWTTRPRWPSPRSPRREVTGSPLTRWTSSAASAPRGCGSKPPSARLGQARPRRWPPPRPPGPRPDFASSVSP